MGNTFRRWVIGGLLAFLVGVVALTGINCSGQMVESGSPMLQEKGLDMLSSMQSNLMSGAG